MFDTHCHIAFSKEKEKESFLQHRNLCGICTLGTSSENWESVRDFSLAPSCRSLLIRGYGVHPWFAHNQPKDYLDKLSQYLDADRNAIIGEIGIDGLKVFGENGMEIQLDVFKDQYLLACEKKRPISVHSVHSITPLFDFLCKVKTFPPAIAFHSFGSTPEMAKDLIKKLKCEVFFGFSYFVNGRAPEKTVQKLMKIPREHVLIETDEERIGFDEDLKTAAKIPSYLRQKEPKETIYEYSLEMIVKIVAKAWNCSEDEVIKTTTDNALRYFTGNNDTTEKL